MLEEVFRLAVRAVMAQRYRLGARAERRMEGGVVSKGPGEWGERKEPGGRVVYCTSCCECSQAAGGKIGKQAGGE